MYLLHDAQVAGTTMVIINDHVGNSLWRAGEESPCSPIMNNPISIEGKVNGYKIINGEVRTEDLPKVVYHTLNLLVQTNIKRMLRE
jgi:hypothetical protein